MCKELTTASVVLAVMNFLGSSFGSSVDTSFSWGKYYESVSAVFLLRKLNPGHMRGYICSLEQEFHPKLAGKFFRLPSLYTGHGSGGSYFIL
jgi:hypothetical protein